jgi:hypothetical protein
MRTLAPLVLVLALAACGGKTAVDASNTNDSGPSADTGPGPLAPGCPAASTEGPCSKEGLLCEYGTDYNAACNTIRICSGGRWASPITFGGAGKCPGSVPTVPPNPASCAATRPAVPAGDSCSNKITCAYDGSICSCGVFCPNYPIRMPDCNPDAGVTTSCCDTTKVAWHCFDGPKYCATSRPRIGTACVTDGESCAFEEAVECGQSRMECRGGVWQIANTSCPASTAGAKEDIHYVSDSDAEYLRQSLMRIPLATYRYKGSDATTHLGFVIEDVEARSPAVLPSRDRVDLYGFVTMAVAALQRQEKDIATLKADVARLVRENAALRARAR